VTQEAQTTADSFDDAVESTQSALSQEQTVGDQLDAAGGTLQDAYSNADAAMASLDDADDALGDAQVAVDVAQGGVEGAQDELDDAQKRLQNCQSGQCDGGDVSNTARKRDGQKIADAEPSCKELKAIYDAAQQTADDAKSAAVAAGKKADLALDSENEAFNAFDDAAAEYLTAAKDMGAASKSLSTAIQAASGGWSNLATATAAAATAASNLAAAPSPGTLADSIIAQSNLAQVNQDTGNRVVGAVSAFGTVAAKFTSAASAAAVRSRAWDKYTSAGDATDAARNAFALADEKARAAATAAIKARGAWLGCVQRTATRK
jgi:chromosome segregation ATPase